MADYDAGTGRIRVLPDTSQFATRLRAQLARIQQDLTIQVQLNTRGLRAELARQMALLRAEAARGITIPIRTSGVRGGLNGGSGSGRQTNRNITTVRGSNNNVDINNSDNRVDNRVINNITNVTNAANQATAATNQLGGSMSRLRAIKLTALTVGIIALVPAIQGAIGAVMGLAAAFGTMAAAGLIGSMGVMGAFQALNEAQETVTAGAGDIAKEQRAAAEAVEDAQRGVIDAYNALGDAQRDAKNAQDDLNDAYKDASRAIRDMNDELQSSYMSVEEAEIRVARARQNLNKVNRDGDSTRLDKREADLRYRQALEQLDQQRKKTQDLKTDTNQANADGVAGSDAVVDATDRLTQANRAQESAAYNLVQAQRALRDAQEDLASGGSTLAGVQDRVAAAMAKLSPNAAAFVLAMQALKPELTEMRKFVQDRLFDQLGESVSTFVTTNLGGFRTVMGEIAGSMNQMLRGTMGDITTLFQGFAADGTMQTFISTVTQAVAGLQPFITGFVEAFVVGTNAMGGSMGTFLASLGEFMVQAAPFMGMIGGEFLTAVSSMLPSIAQLLNAIAVGMGPMLGPLANLISSIANALVPLAAPLGTLFSQLANSLAPLMGPIGNFLAALGPPATKLIELLGDILLALTPLLEPFAQLIDVALTPMIEMFSTIVEYCAPFIAQLVEQLTPVIQQLSPMFGEMARVIGQMLMEALVELAPVMQPLISAFLKFFTEAIVPLMPKLLQLALQLFPIMVALMVELAPEVTKILEIMTELAVLVLPWVIKAIEFTLEGFDNMLLAFNTFTGSLQDAWTWLTEKWDGFVNWIKELPGKIRENARGAWDGLKDAFKNALNWIIEKWNGFSITIGGWKWDPPGPGPTFTIPEFKMRMPQIPKLATGGAVRDADGRLSGPGTGTSDSIFGINAHGIPVVRVAAGETVVTAAASADPLNAAILAAMNRGDALPLPGFAGGGVLPTTLDGYTTPPGTVGGTVQLGNISGEGITSGIQLSMWDTLRKQFPDAVLSSATRTVQTEGHPDFHNAAKAIDLGGPIGNLQPIADWINNTYPDSLELFWDPGPNRKNGAPTGAIGGHGDHVHWAYDRILAPQDMELPSDGSTWSNPSDSTPEQEQSESEDNVDETERIADESEDVDPEAESATSWSKIAGDATAGYVQDTLGVFGIPDEIPGAIQAGQIAWSELSKDPSKRLQLDKNGNLVRPKDDSDTNGDGATRSDDSETTDGPGQSTSPNGQPQSGNEPADTAALAGATGLTMSSSREQVAKAILEEAKKRGYTQAEAMAILATAIQESNLDPRAIGGGGAWHGIYQQDTSYPGRDDANTQITGFFDRLDGKKGDDIWKRIFWLQQRPGEASADAAYANGRQSYMAEIQEHQGDAESLAGVVKVYDQGGYLDPYGVAINKSGKPEPVLTAAQWEDVGGILDVLMGEGMDGAFDLISGASKTAMMSAASAIPGIGPAAASGVETALNAIGSVNTVVESALEAREKGTALAASTANLGASRPTLANSGFNSQAALEAAAAGAARTGGPVDNSSTYHLSGTDLEELFRRARTLDAQRMAAYQGATP